jgi:hypothetical protein
MTMRRLIAVLVGIAVLLILGAGPASAGPLVDRAAETLRRDPVFVDDAAERKISGGEAEQIRERIRKSGQPVFVAVLPQAATAEAGGDPTSVATALGQATGLQGTYAVLVGTSFRASSSSLPRGTAGTLATAAFQRSRDQGPGAVLLDFVDRVDKSASGASSGSREGRSEGSGDSSGGVGLLVPVLLVGAAGGGGGYWLWRKRKKAQEVQDAREGLRPELQLLADDVLDLEPELALHPDAQADYDAAVSRYRAANAAMDQVRSMAQVERLRRILAEGNYAMARARARVDGREPPPPPPELASPGAHQEPAVVVDERGEPAYAGYGGGWYGGGGWFGGGDMLTGILIGSALGGGGWGGGWGGGYGHDHGGGDHGGDAGDGGGDFGGGDFGGGDFGGGDFGGGDFGGGGDF